VGNRWKPTGTHKVNSVYPLIGCGANFYSALLSVNNKNHFWACDTTSSNGKLFSMIITSGNSVVTEITPPGIILSGGIHTLFYYNNFVVFQSRLFKHYRLGTLYTDGTAQNTNFVCRFKTGTNTNFKMCR
jgi:hypothetical protein